jgi:hypothetical protein
LSPGIWIRHAVRVTCIALICVAFMPVPPAQAATTCYDAGNWWVGHGFEPTTYEPTGARATVLLRGTDLCNNPTHYTDSSAWAMVASDTTVGYAQIGYLKHNAMGCGCGSQQFRFFYEWAKCSTCSSFGQVYFGTPNLGNTVDFKVSRDDSSGHLVMYLNGATPNCSGTCPFSNCTSGQNECPETNFDPNNAWGGTNNQWYGEILDRANDAVGTSGSRAVFSDVQTRKHDGSWVNQNWNFSGSGSLLPPRQRGDS